MLNKLFYSISIIILCTMCTPEPKKTDSSHGHSHAYVEEHHSYALPNEAVITHLNLDIEADFETRTISGSASYDINNFEGEEIILDVKHLMIKKVTADGKPTKFSLGKFDEQLGQPLHIKIGADTKKIAIEYATTDKTEALQWLNPQQTADKTDPFLLSQGQAILTRSWIPIQDSPQIRVTYDAKVKVPSNLMAVMSAENPKEKAADGIYTFKMRQPISPYLIALAIGNIEYKSISDRTGIYAEKSLLDKAHYEFGDMEKMVVAAEKLYGSYEWDQFDVIVLPPSFPFGGMENPRLTFATPTVIAGDRSLTSLIAHELAHSWSGNLVTNATWNDFWLNEGFTVYFEMRIMEALYGKDHANMLALISRQDLEDEMTAFAETPDETKLKLDLKGRNPDDGMNSIAYDKGYLFLRTIEEKIGREKFDSFLKTYFETHAFSTMDTERFVKYLNINLLDKYSIEFNTDEWIYKAGIPSNQAIIKSDRFENAEKVLAEIIKTKDINPSLTKDWSPQEWVHFIRNFPKKMDKGLMSKIDKTYDLTHSTNSYIAMVWYEQSINHDYHGNGIDQEIEKFLINVGRRWYVSTIYKALKNNGQTEKGREIYKKAKANYHSVTSNTIDEILEVG